MLTFISIAWLSSGISTTEIDTQRYVAEYAGPQDAAVIEMIDGSALVPQRPMTVRARVENYFADTPVMARIAWCESKFQHTEEDGTVLRGSLTPADVGVMQINTRYHGDRAAELGYDLTTLQDNLAYARDLYERRGTQPWSASRDCWSDRHIASVK